MRRDAWKGKPIRRFVVAGLLFNLALLIIGLTWIVPLAHRRPRAGVPVPSAPAAPASGSPTPAASPSTSPGGPVTVTLAQWSITPSATTARAGPITFVVSNAGTITHEFVVIRSDTPAADFRIGSFEGEKDRINEDTVGTNVGETGDLEAGATQSLSLDLRPGHYAFVCNLPGHYGLGMHIDFTVA
jgi:uncharacterized cupredoxin-like copper-binding protein